MPEGLGYLGPKRNKGSANTTSGGTLAPGMTREMKGSIWLGQSFLVNGQSDKSCTCMLSLYPLPFR